MSPHTELARLPQWSVETASKAAEEIRPLVRISSPTLTAACERVGMSPQLADLCGGLLASVVEDLATIGHLRRTDFERTKRMRRVLEAAEEPAVYALRMAIAASPVNGKAAVAHWDAIADPHEVGKLAWLLGMDTEMAWAYGKRQERRNRKEGMT